MIDRITASVKPRPPVERSGHYARGQDEQGRPAKQPPLIL